MSILMKALVIDEPWISAILLGVKTWEMRKGVCKLRGPIALIRKGSGQVVGIAEVTDCRPPLNTPAAYAEAEPYHRIPPARQGQAFADGWRTPWVLANARPLKKPVPYKHPSGAVIWVTLDDAVSAAISEQVSPVPPAPDVTNGSSANPPIRSEPKWEMAAPPEVQQEVDRSLFPLGNARIVIVTGGNLRNNHIYLPLDFFPPDAIGGKSKAEAAPRTISITFRPGTTIDSDIDRSKRILRARSEVGEFLARARIAEGDSVRIVRTGPYAYEFSKATDA
jgi:hypothetical protein